MPQKMLIDATQPEEIRVAVVDQKRLEEFDYETTAKKQLKGNIYLAKVVRIEPSLQAAFVDYGGQKHGFLSFQEIHPDYFQIPVDDRHKLIAQARASEETQDTETVVILDDESGEEASRSSLSSEEENHGEESADVSVELDAGEVSEDQEGVDEDLSRRGLRLHQKYKIQEVIKRHQVLLVQVTKEERGNKGAALTTYISLAGRYCVLMPNTLRRGGVSRKIVDAQDRKRLKEILDSIALPETMGVIVRTAGIKSTKAEIKKDVDYLQRLWHNIREDTLQSNAPALIHAEGNLIRRCLRDMYTKDIEQIVIAGEEGYKSARDLMRMLVPSHVKRVVMHPVDAPPLFVHYGIEKQINDMDSPRIQLRSGGSLVIGQTEALVAIDVNSGRATRERHIKETALKTNLEAAEEIARHLRLRDLAGLIVIDFIDMDDAKHRQAVERKLKEAVRRDRARIQTGHISPFGLLEMSRQRLRPSLSEAISSPCSHCQGSGWVRSKESVALQVLRHIEHEIGAASVEELVVSTHPDVAFYMLNQKRSCLARLEERYDTAIVINPQHSVPNTWALDKILRSSKGEEEKKEEGAAVDEVRSPQSSPEAGAAGGKKRRRSRRGGRHASKTKTIPIEGETMPSQEAAGELSVSESQEQEPHVHVPEVIEPEGEKPKSRRRRHSRRGARSSQGDKENQESQEAEPAVFVASENPQKQDSSPDVAEGSSSKRRGWWKRLVE